MVSVITKDTLEIMFDVSLNDIIREQVIVSVGDTLSIKIFGEQVFNMEIPRQSEYSIVSFPVKNKKFSFVYRANLPSYLIHYRVKEIVMKLVLENKDLFSELRAIENFQRKVLEKIRG